MSTQIYTSVAVTRLKQVHASAAGAARRRIQGSQPDGQQTGPATAVTTEETEIRRQRDSLEEGMAAYQKLIDEINAKIPRG